MLFILSIIFIASQGGLSLGITTIGISSVNIVSNPEGVIDTDALAVFFKDGGMGQSLSGTLSAQEISNQISNTGKVAGKGFTFDSEVTTERCFYPYQKTTLFTPLGKNYRYYAKDLGFYNLLGGLTDLKNRCDQYGDSIYWFKPQWSLNGYCVYGVQNMGSIATFNTGKHQFYSKNTLTIDGAPSITKYITNSSDVGTEVSNTTVDFSDIATLTWNGNFTSGDTCATVEPSNLVAVNTNISDNTTSWKVVQRTYAEDYRLEQSRLTSKLNGIPSFGAMVDQVNFVNSLQDKLLRNTQTTIENNQVNSSTAYGGAFYYNASGINFPTFTLYIKADTLQIVQPVPKVVSLNTTLNNNILKSGSKANININWVNDGSKGNFTVSNSCTGSLTAVENTKYVNNVETQALAVTTHEISSSCTSDQTGSCTITVKPQSLFGNGVPESKTVTGNCSPETICNANEKVCFGNILKTCSSNGANFVSALEVNCLEQAMYCDQSQQACAKEPPTQRCGDTICSGTENWLTCAVDCIKPQPEPDVEKAACEAKNTDIFISSWDYTPPQAFGLVNSTCKPIYNFTLIAIIIGVTFVLVIGAYIMVSYPPKRRKRK